MKDFFFSQPTKIYFGRGKENLIGEILKEHLAKEVLIVVGQSSVKKSGLLDKVINLLDKNGIRHHVLEDIRPNPTIIKVREGIKIAKEKNIDFLLAIGGGSVIDTAKLIAVGYYYDGDPFDFNKHITTPAKALPLGCILTIAASGSEMSTSCVIQDDNENYKMGFNHELNRPLFVIENPELTYSVNKEQTAYGVVDIIMHTLERYLCPSENDELTDSISEGLLRNVIKAGTIAYNDPTNYEARATLMYASSLSHNDLTSMGKIKAMPVHALEHAISGKYPFVAHAAGLAVMFFSWAYTYVDYDVEKFNSFAENVFHSYNEDKKINAYNGIRLLRKYFGSLSMPKTLKDLGIENIDAEELSNMVTSGGTRLLGQHKKMFDKEDVKKMYLASF